MYNEGRGVDISRLSSRIEKELRLLNIQGMEGADMQQAAKILGLN
jgi:hypothetical protein